VRSADRRSNGRWLFSLPRLVATCLALWAEPSAHTPAWSAQSTAKAADDPAPMLGVNPGCGSGDADLCQAKVPKADLRKLERNAKRGLTYRVDGEFLDFLFTRERERFAFGRAPFLCCDLQAYLAPIKPGVWATRFRVHKLDRAVLDLYVANTGPEDASVQTYVGRHADHAALDPEAPVKSVEDIAIDSKALEGKREIHVFTGAHCAVIAPPCRIVYLADGDGFRVYINNAPPIMLPVLDDLIIVGLDSPSNSSMSNDTRGDELLRDFHQPAFAAFEMFLTQEVIPRVEGSAHGAVPRLVAGWSDGGAWAADMALRHPDDFCGALAFSMGSWKPSGGRSAPAAGPAIFWIGSGALEGRFYSNNMRYSALLRKAGFDVRERYPTGGHSPATWNDLFWWALADRTGAAEWC
jgi:enterochelin esterase-like enzyme